MKITLECLDKTNVKTSVEVKTDFEKQYAENVKAKDGNYQFLFVLGIKYLEKKNQLDKWEEFKNKKIPGSKLVIDIPDLESAIQTLGKTSKN